MSKQILEYESGQPAPVSGVRRFAVVLLMVFLALTTVMASRGAIVNYADATRATTTRDARAIRVAAHSGVAVAVVSGSSTILAAWWLIRGGGRL